MEREISLSVEIAVALIAISALIGILWVTVFMGQDMANDMSLTASDVLVSMEEGKLHELTQTHNVMPTAAVYSLLRTNGNSIGEVKCRLANATCPEKGSKMCVLKHLEGRVSLQVELLDLGWYKLTIHEADCEWFYGANKCTCPVKS